MLAIASVALFPCWPYSQRWGYRPSVAAGIVLVFVALLAAAGKPRAVPTEASVAALPSPRSDGTHDTSRKLTLVPRDIETTQRDIR